MGVVVKVWPHMSYKCALNELAGSHYTLQDKEIPAYLIIIFGGSNPSDDIEL